jgi:hypothetical protein
MSLLRGPGAAPTGSGKYFRTGSWARAPYRFGRGGLRRAARSWAAKRRVQSTVEKGDGATPVEAMMLRFTWTLTPARLPIPDQISSRVQLGIV